MNITRRKFFFFGLAAGVGLLLPDTKITLANKYTLDRELVILKVKEMTKDAMNEYRRQIDYALMGIPYHQNNGTTGIWLGFDRSNR